MALPIPSPAPLSRASSSRAAAPGGPDAARASEPVRHRLYVHLAWTTLDGLPLVGPRQALALEGQLIALCRRLDVEPVEVALAADRAHLLLRIKPVQAVAAVAARLKEGSARAAVRRGEAVRWARGWAVATVAPDEVRRVKRLMGAASLAARQLTPGIRDS